MIKKIFLIFFLLTSQASASVEVFFSPYQNCESQFLQVIQSAKKSIMISCFGLTNENIFNALVKKHNEGVKVLVCEDKMQSGSRHDYRDRLKAAGIEVVVKKLQVLQHNKMVAVDGEDGIIGSWNLSGNAQKQDNSIVVFNDEPVLVGQITEAINRIYQRDVTSSPSLILQ